MFNSMVQLESTLLEDLHRAARACDTQQMKRLLRRGVVVSSESTQRGFVQQALKSGDQELLTLLLERGMQLPDDPVTVTEALHNAAEDGDTKLLGLLLEHGARQQVNYVIPEVKDTALHLAVRGNHLETVQLLLSHCADVNALTSTRRCCYGDDNFEFFIDENVTALHLAAEEGHFEVTKALLLRGCAVNAITVHGYTALHLAVVENHENIVCLLLQNGAKISLLTKEGESVMDIVKRRCHTKILRTLEVHMTTVVLVSSEDTYDEEERIWVTRYLKKIPKRKQGMTKKQVKQRKISTEVYARDEASSTTRSKRSPIRMERDVVSEVTLVRAAEDQRQTMTFMQQQSSSELDGGACYAPPLDTSLDDRLYVGIATENLVKMEKEFNTEVYGEADTRPHIKVKSEDAISQDRSSGNGYSSSHDEAEYSSMGSNDSFDNTLSRSWHSREARPIIDASVTFKSQRTTSLSQHSPDSTTSKVSSTESNSFSQSFFPESGEETRSNLIPTAYTAMPFADEYVDELESPNIRYPDRTDEDVFRELCDIQGSELEQSHKGHIIAHWTKAGDIEMIITERDMITITGDKDNDESSCHLAFETSNQDAIDLAKTPDTSDDECEYQDALSSLEDIETLTSNLQDNEHKASKVDMDESDDEEYLSDQTMRAAITFLQIKYDYEDEDNECDTLSENEEDNEDNIGTPTLTGTSAADSLTGHHIEISNHLEYSTHREEGVIDENVSQVLHDDATFKPQQELISQSTHAKMYLFEKQEKIVQDSRKMEGPTVTGDLVLLSMEQDTSHEVHRVPLAAMQRQPIRRNELAKDVNSHLKSPGSSRDECTSEYQYGTQTAMSSINLQDNKMILEGASGTTDCVILSAVEDINLEVYRIPCTTTQQSQLSESISTTDTHSQVHALCGGQTESTPKDHNAAPSNHSTTRRRNSILKGSKVEDVLISGELVLHDVEHNDNLEKYRVPLKLTKHVSFADDDSNDELELVTSHEAEQENTLEEQYPIQCHMQDEDESTINDDYLNQVESSYSQGDDLKIASDYQENELAEQIQIETSEKPEPQLNETQISQLYQAEATHTRSFLDGHIKEALPKRKDAVAHIKKKSKVKEKKKKLKKSDRALSDVISIEEDVIQEVIEELIRAGEFGNIPQYNTSPSELVEFTNEDQSQEQYSVKQEHRMEEQTISGNSFLVKFSQEPDSNQIDKASDIKIAANLVLLREEQTQDGSQLEMRENALCEYKYEKPSQWQLESQLDDQQQFESGQHWKRQHAKPYSSQHLFVDTNKGKDQNLAEGFVVHQEHLIQIKNQHQTKPEDEVVVSGSVLLNAQDYGRLEKLTDNKNDVYTESSAAGYEEITNISQEKYQMIDSLRTDSSTEISDFKVSEHSSGEDCNQKYAEKIEHIDSDGNVLYVEYIPFDSQDQANDDLNMIKSNMPSFQINNDIDKSTVTEKVTTEVFLQENSIHKNWDHSNVRESQPDKDNDAEIMRAANTDLQNVDSMKIDAMREVTMKDTDAQQNVDLETMKAAMTDNQLNQIEKYTGEVEVSTAGLETCKSMNQIYPNTPSINRPTNTIDFIDEDYIDIRLRKFSPGLLDDDSQKKIREPEDEVYEEESVESPHTKPGINDSAVSPCRGNVELKEEMVLIPRSSPQEHELITQVNSDEVVAPKKPKKKKKKKKQAKDEKKKSKNSVSSITDQQHQEEPIVRQPTRTEPSEEKEILSGQKTTVILQEINVSDTIKSLHAPTKKDRFTEVKYQLNLPNDQAKPVAQLNDNAKTTRADIKQESTIDNSPVPEQDPRRIYRNIIDEMKFKFNQQESLPNDEEDESPIELKQDVMEAMGAALSYMNKKYDIDSDEEIECTNEALKFEPTRKLSTTKMEARSTTTSRSTDIDSLLVSAHVNTADKEEQPDVEVKDTRIQEITGPTRPTKADIQIESTVTSHVKSKIQQMPPILDESPITGKTKYYHQDYQDQSGTTAENQGTKLAHQPITDGLEAERRDGTLTLDIKPEQEDSIALVEIKKKKKKKPARPSRRTQSTKGEDQELMKSQEISVENANNIQINVDHPSLPDSSHTFHDQTSYTIVVAKEETPAEKVYSSASKSSPKASTKLPNAHMASNKESADNSQLLNQLSLEDDIANAIAQQDQDILILIPEKNQKIEAISKEFSHYKNEHSGVGVKSPSPSISSDLKRLSSKENIPHSDATAIGLSQEEYIMDAVVDADQSEIVAKIDQIIIDSLSKSKGKYKSQGSSDEEQTEDSKNDAHSRASNSSHDASTSKLKSRHPKSHHNVPYVAVSTTHMKPMQTEKVPEKVATDIHQIYPEKGHEQWTVQQQIENSSSSLANVQQVSPVNMKTSSSNKAHEMQSSPCVPPSTIPRESLVRVTDLDDYMRASGYSLQTDLLNHDLDSNTSSTSKRSIPKHKLNIVKKPAIVIDQSMNYSPTSNTDGHPRVSQPISQDKQATDDKSIVTSDRNIKSSSIDLTLSTQSIPNEQGLDKIITIGLPSHPTKQQEQIADRVQQPCQGQVFPNIQHASNAQQGQQETLVGSTSTTIASLKHNKIAISPKLEPPQHDSQLPKGETEMELQGTIEEKQTPVKKKKSKTKDKTKKKLKKAKKKAAEESIILSSADQAARDEVIIAGQGENIPQSNVSISENMEINSKKELHENDISPAGITITSTPENQHQSQKPPPLDSSGNMIIKTDYNYSDFTPPSHSSFSGMPPNPKCRKISISTDDADENDKDKEDFNLSEPNIGRTVTSHPSTTVKPRLASYAKERSVSHIDESFTSPRESAKKSRPMSIPDVYVLLKFDKGSLSNLGVTKNDDSSKPLARSYEGTLDINPSREFYSTEPPLRVLQNTSFQTDPHFLDASGGSHFDFGDSMKTKSMDELDVEHTSRQVTRNKGQRLRRSQSGGALQNTDKRGWGSSQRESKPSNHDRSRDVLRANQTFDIGDPIKGPSGSGGVQFRGLDQVSVYHSQTHVGSPNYRQVTRVAMAQVPIQRSRSKSRERAMPMQGSNPDSLQRASMPHQKAPSMQHSLSEGQVMDGSVPIAKSQVINQRPPKSPKCGDGRKEKTGHQPKSPTWADSNTETVYHQPKSQIRNDGYQQTVSQPIKSSSGVDAQTTYHQPKLSTHDYINIETKQRTDNLQTAYHQRPQSWIGIQTANQQAVPSPQSVPGREMSAAVRDIKRTGQHPQAWVDTKTKGHKATLPIIDGKPQRSGRAEVTEHPVMPSSWVNVQESGYQQRTSTQDGSVLQTTRSLGNLQSPNQPSVKSPINTQISNYQPRSSTHRRTTIETRWSGGIAKQQQLQSLEIGNIQTPNYKQISPSSQETYTPVLETSQSIGNLQTSDQQIKSPTWTNIQEVSDRQRRSRPTNMQLETTQSVTNLQASSYPMRTPSWMKEERSKYPIDALDYSIEEQFPRVTTPARPRPTTPEQKGSHGFSRVTALFTRESKKQPQRTPPSSVQILVQQHHRQQQYTGPPFEPNQRRRDRIPSAPTTPVQQYRPVVSPARTNNSRLSDPTGLSKAFSNKDIDTDIW